MNHVVIIGFMGSGKTRAGKQLSKDLGLQFVDLDKLITKKMNLSAREIFEKFGEPYYRALETVALKQLIQDSEQGQEFRFRNRMKNILRNRNDRISERFADYAEKASGRFQERSDA